MSEKVYIITDVDGVTAPNTEDLPFESEWTESQLIDMGFTQAELSSLQTLSRIFLRALPGIP